MGDSPQLTSAQRDSLRKAQLVFSRYSLQLNRIYTVLSLCALTTSGISTVLQPFEPDDHETETTLTYVGMTVGIITTAIIGFLHFTKLHTNANKMESIAKLLALYTSGIVDEKGLVSLRKEVIDLIRNTHFLWLRVPPLDFVPNETASEFKPPVVLNTAENDYLSQTL